MASESIFEIATSGPLGADTFRRWPTSLGRPHPTFDAAARRALDLGIAISALIFLAPLLVIVALVVALEDGGPILFAQERMGLGGRTFRCWKFRSMVTDAQQRLDHLLASDPAARAEWERDHKLRRDVRITRCGKFLRKSSLDELPQLLNVIAGEMSIVGPRPIVAAEVRRYSTRFATYCTVKPGLTGLWQVSGRSDTTYRRRVAMDALYARKRTLILDLWIILATIPAVFAGRGSY